MKFCNFLLVYIVFNFGMTMLIVNSNAAVSSTQNYTDYYDEMQGDDDYAYDDQEDENRSDKGKSDSIDYTLDQSPPYFEVSEMSLDAKEGDNIILPCDVKNYHNNVVLWYKGGTVIASNTIIVAGHKRFKVLENKAIQISEVRPSDSDEYYCEIMPQKTQFHVQLNVLAIPKVEIYYHDKLVTSKELVFQSGQSAEFDCKAYMMKNAELKWSINGVRAENLVSKIVNGKIFIDSFDLTHTGSYGCLGDVKGHEGALPSATIYVRVLHAPEVSTHRHYVNTMAGDNAELQCDFTTDLKPKVTWLRNGEALPISSKKYRVQEFVQIKRNRSVLYINSIQQDDLGEYVCEVKNKLGEAHTKIHLIFEPETPQFETIEIKDKTVSIYWLVRSLQPLVEAVMDYRLNGTANHWMTQAIIASDKHPQKQGFWKLRHDFDLMPGEWQARVRTKNTIDWSKFSNQHDFIVPDKMMKVGGISIGGETSKATDDIPKLSVLVMSSLVLKLWSSIKL